MCNLCSWLYLKCSAELPAVQSSPYSLASLCSSVCNNTMAPKDIETLQSITFQDLHLREGSKEYHKQPSERRKLVTV